MKKIFAPILVLATVISAYFVFTSFNKVENVDEKSKAKSFHDFKVKTIDGETFDLAQLKGKKVMVVNVASKCGLTPQYKVLQKLYESLDKSKYEIIAFPANNFLEQEPGTNSEIKEFCSKNYGVTFPIMDKVSVCDFIYNSYPTDTAKATKTSTDEIYQWLTQKSQNGVMDSKMKWNFQKFLIDENGNLVGVLPPSIGEEILTLKSWFFGE